MRKFFAGAVAASCLFGSAFAAEPEACRTVKFAEVDWTDVRATTAVAATLLEAIGYKTSIARLDVPVAYASLHSKENDVFMGTWLPAMEDDLRPYLDGDTIENLGPSLSIGAFYTLAVPDYTYAKGLKDFADISKFKDSLHAKIHGIEQGNDGNEHVLDMIKDPKLGLGGFELVESSEDGMLQDVAKAYEKKEDIVFIGWAPHPMNLKFKFKFLSGGDAFFGPNMGAATVNTSVRQGYASQCANVGKFLKQVKFNIDMENELMDQILNKQEEPMDAAAKWLRANADAFKPWLSGVTAADGSAKALDALKLPLVK